MQDLNERLCQLLMMCAVGSMKTDTTPSRGSHRIHGLRPHQRSSLHEPAIQTSPGVKAKMPAGDCTWHPGVPSGPIHPPSLKAQSQCGLCPSHHTRGRSGTLMGGREQTGPPDLPWRPLTSLRPPSPLAAALHPHLEDLGPLCLISVFLECFSKLAAFCWRILFAGGPLHAIPLHLSFPKSSLASISTKTHTHTRALEYNKLLLV